MVKPAPWYELAVNPLDMFNDPLKEEEPVPLTWRLLLIEAAPMTSNVPEIDVSPSNLVLPSTSSLPETRRSFDVERKLLVVVLVPNLEYAAEDNPPPPTWIVLAAIKYEALAVP